MWIVKPSFLAVVLVGFLEAHANAQETISVQIDFDTRSSENTIAIGKRSIILVAIITTDGFNAAKRVDHEGVMIATKIMDRLPIAIVFSLLRVSKSICTEMVSWALA